MPFSDKKYKYGGSFFFAVTIKHLFAKYPGRVGRHLAAPTPPRTGLADFPHPAPHK